MRMIKRSSTKFCSDDDSKELTLIIMKTIIIMKINNKRWIICEDFQDNAKINIAFISSSQTRTILKIRVPCFIRKPRTSRDNNEHNWILVGKTLVDVDNADTYQPIHKFDRTWRYIKPSYMSKMTNCTLVFTISHALEEKCFCYTAFVLFPCEAKLYQ